VLQSLSRDDFELLRPHLRDVKLEHGKVLFDQGGHIEHVYFPYSGAVSFVVPLSDGVMIEAGLIGKDGVVGTPAALNGAKSLSRAVVQVPCEAVVMRSHEASAAVAASESLRAKLYQHDQLLLAQAQQSAACHAMHNVEERLCRWILRSRDVVETDTLQLTQEFIAQMIGVRRTSVTLAASHLQKIGFIKYRRGNIRIVDVDGASGFSMRVLRGGQAAGSIHARSSVSSYQCSMSCADRGLALKDAASGSSGCKSNWNRAWYRCRPLPSRTLTQRRRRSTGFLRFSLASSATASQSSVLTASRFGSWIPSSSGASSSSLQMSKKYRGTACLLGLVG
jgi:CRP-like cAMP-binding protein